MLSFSSFQVIYSAPDVDSPGTHGGSTHVAESVHSLAKICHHVYLICAHRKPYRYVETKKNITFIRIPHFSSSLLRTISCFLFPFFITLFLQFIRPINLVYERGRIFGGGSVLAGRLFWKTTVYELIEPYTIVPVILGTVQKNSFLHKLISSWHIFMVHCATLITITHHSFLQIVPQEKAYFIHTGANPHTFRPDLSVSSLQKRYRLYRGKTLLYTGSFSRWHACTTMIRATAPLLKKDKQLKLLMIGVGEHFKASIALAYKLKLQGQILFPGKVPFDQIPSYIAAADICFALFDRSYPPFQALDYYYSPIKVHEYKASGKPIIASNIGTLQTYVVDGKNGFLVRENRPQEITVAVRKLLHHTKLCRAIGKRNRKEVVDLYNWDIQNKKLLMRLFLQER